MTSKTDSSGTMSYVYDSENRLIELRTPNAQLVTYKYDPFGRRIEKNVNGVITRYVYDREDILFELDGSNNVITEFVHGHGIDEPIAMIKNNQTYYYHADGLGSIIAITDANGNVVQRYEYDSFGNIIYQQDTSFLQPYTYTGREYDEETGLYYYRARYYSSELQRFISEDPIRLKGGINFFRYVKNNPIKFIDPLGLEGCGPGPKGGWGDRLVPDAPLGYDFKKCCDDHDDCYKGDYGCKPRAECDEKFCNCLLDVCSSVKPENRSSCGKLSSGYCGAVKGFGWMFFNPGPPGCIRPEPDVPDYPDLLP